MFGIKIPKFGSKQSYPWIIGGLAVGAGLYFILTGQNTGIGPLDVGLQDIGNITKLEGIFPNTTAAGLRPAPGKTTIVAQTPATAGGGGPAGTFGSSHLQFDQFAGAGIWEPEPIVAGYDYYEDDKRLTVA